MQQQRKQQMYRWQLRQQREQLNCRDPDGSRGNSTCNSDNRIDHDAEMTAEAEQPAAETPVNDESSGINDGHADIVDAFNVDAEFGFL